MMIKEELSLIFKRLFGHYLYIGSLIMYESTDTHTNKCKSTKHSQLISVILYF